MTFYTYSSIIAKQHQWQYTKIIINSVLIIILLALALRYFRHRWDVKYKDLAIISGAFLLLSLAMQYNDFRNVRASAQQNGQMVGILQQAAKKLNVKPSSLAANATSQTNNGLLLKSGEHVYQVLFNADGSEFTLNDTHLIKPKITVTEAQ